MTIIQSDRDAESVRDVVKRVIACNDAHFERAKQGNWPIYRAASAGFAAGVAHREASEAPLKEQIAQRDALLREVRPFIVGAIEQAITGIDFKPEDHPLITQIDALTQEPNT